MPDDDYMEAYSTWKKVPGPEANAAILKTLHPVMEGAVRTHVGEPNPLIMSQARILSLQGLRGYDPSKGKLATHLYNHLQGLKRINRKQTAILRVPERIAMARNHLDDVTKELTNVLGREPTDDELANKTGFSAKRMTRIRSFRPGYAEGALEATGEGNVFGGVVGPGGADHSSWASIVYDGLDDHHKKVMEYAFGLNGRRALPNQDIARKMNRSPGAISQAKGRIQVMLDEEHELSPFGAR